MLRLIEWVEGEGRGVMGLMMGLGMGLMWPGSG